MKKSIIISFFAIFTAVGFTSCLDTDSDRFVDWDRDLTAQDSVYHMLGILNNLKEIGTRYVLLGELRGDLMISTDYAPTELKELHAMDISGTNSYTTQREYYKIINQCNYLIEKGKAIPLERAAAISIRAWTYLQLVLNYGKVKYYTDFIHDAEGANVNYPELGLDELLNTVIPQLEAIKNLKLPNYGVIGGSSLPNQMIPAKLILADYYMWAGYNNPSNYEKAAQLYFEYLMNEGLNTSHLSATPYLNSSPSGLSNVYNDRQYYKYANSTLTSGYYNQWGRNYNREPITTIDYSNPDSTVVRMNLDSLCGSPYFELEDIAIKQSKLASSLFSNEEYAYVDIENESDYISQLALARFVNPLVPNYNRKGDLRSRLSLGVPSDLYYMYSNISSNAYEDTVVVKYASQYGIWEGTRNVSLYRIATVYLRYAEALNRLGKPNLAMIALKYGLNITNIYMYMPLNEKKLDLTTHEDGSTTARFEGVYAWDHRTSVNAQVPGTFHFGAIPVEWIDEYEGKVPLSITFLESGFDYRLEPESDTIFYFFQYDVEDYYDFSKNTSYFAYNAGLHSRGAGCSAADYTYKMPYEVYPMPKFTKTDEATLKLQQEYVEEMIAKEYALETAFEGNRFQDLMRISRHQGSPDFLARHVSKKEGAPSYGKLISSSVNGWDSQSWYLPVNTKEK